jgi:hypothetical protein
MDQSINIDTVAITPHPFGELVKTWLKVTHMTEAFFEEERAHVSVANTLIGVALYAVYSSVLTAVMMAGTGMFSPESMLGFPPEMIQFWSIAVYAMPICGLFMTPVSFYLTNGLTYLGARIFGGRGEFKTQAYLFSLFFIPLGIVSGLTGLLISLPSMVALAGSGENVTWLSSISSLLSGLISLGIAIYQAILTVRSLKVTHQFSTGKAVGAFLAPVVVMILIFCVLSALIPLLESALGNFASPVF